VTWTASATGCGSPEYLITVMAPSGTWTTPQNWSPNAVFTWTTTGLASGDYLFEVQARSAGSSSWQVYRDVTYTLNPSSAGISCRDLPPMADFRLQIPRCAIHATSQQRHDARDRQSAV